MCSDNDSINFMHLTTMRYIRSRINYDVFMQLLEFDNGLNERRNWLRHELMQENGSLKEELDLDLKYRQDSVFEMKQRKLFELLSTRNHIRKAVVKEKLELLDRMNSQELRIKQQKDACKDASVSNWELSLAKMKEAQNQREFENNLNKMINYIHEEKDLDEQNKSKIAKLNAKMYQQFLINQMDEKEQLNKYKKTNYNYNAKIV